MSQARWWTCGCGLRNVSQGPGRPMCKCGKSATFVLAARPGQMSLFAGSNRESATTRRYDERLDAGEAARHE